MGGSGLSWEAGEAAREGMTGSTVGRQVGDGGREDGRGWWAWQEAAGEAAAVGEVSGMVVVSGVRVMGGAGGTVGVMVVVM